MSRARRSAPAVLHLLGGLTLLLLCPPAVRGDCGLPPDIPNAQPPLGGLTRFPEDATITYKCNEGFVKVPGKPDSVVCIKDKWSEVAEFCNRSCDVPTRLVFASLKQPYSKQSYFPAGSTVEYECRLGYEKDQSLSGKLTCLQDFTWSKPAEFCKKKACPDPGKIKNGHVNIPSGILFGSAIFFSCNTGYELVGVTSSYCLLMGKDVGWRDPLPECKESLPATKAPPAVQKPTAVNVQATEPAPIAQKPTSATVPATEPPPASQKPTSANASATEVPATAQKPPVSNALPRETSPAAQNPNTAKDSAAQATPTAQRASTTKASFTQSLPTTQKSTAIHAPVAKGLQTTQTSVRITAIRGLAVPRATTRFHATSTSKGRGTPPSSGAMILTSGKSGSQTVKRKCHCGMYNPYSWKRILSFNCLRSTIKMQCLRLPKRKWVHAFQHVLWTPLGARYVPKYSQPCSCSKAIFGQLQVIWPISRVLLHAHCLKASF